MCTVTAMLPTTVMHVVVKQTPRYYQQLPRVCRLHVAQGISRCTLAVLNHKKVVLLEPYTLLDSSSRKLSSIDGNLPMLTITLFSPVLAQKVLSELPV